MCSGVGRRAGRKRRFMIVGAVRFRLGGEEGMDTRG